MVDISVEILGSSVLASAGREHRFHVKTWWAQVDVPLGPEDRCVQLPRLPMTQKYLVMTKRDTTIFVETWEERIEEEIVDEFGDAIPSTSAKLLRFREKPRFVGITTCAVDEQLKNTNLNPSVQWLPVRDPIENIARGKLLLKVDARFAFPNTNINELEIPVRIDDPPPRTPPPSRTLPSLYHSSNNNYLDSPEKHSAFSRKSETSVFSVGSASSVRSQDQGIQTDLSLTVLPDISKYTAALKAHSASVKECNRRASSSQQHSHHHQIVSRKKSKSMSGPDVLEYSPIVDPLQVAQNLLLKGTASNYFRRDSADSSLKGSESASSSSAALRRKCLVKQQIRQEQQQFQTPRKPSEDNSSKRLVRSSQAVDEDVIDLLNEKVHSFFSTPNSQPNCTPNADGYKMPHPVPPNTERRPGENDRIDFQIRRLTPEPLAKEYGAAGVNNHQRNSRQSNTNDDFVGRFKEIHFDGEFAKQQAMTNIRLGKTVPPKAPANPPPMIRRRIAANIFND